ncbi:hypothetical protein GUJ93_ZPchr0015g6837 [Zizania palustris]|uniref:HhH-GPD domain-containing protein n=1 Tax=Zizania palustris TaxID=103762 RepID=A0A8J5THJ8_ZIZPA|nr:hypothetical protein GUJ93_ZPchr0015g6837 [Zizania palustris]
MRKREQRATPSPPPLPSAAGQISIQKEEKGMGVRKKKRNRRENKEEKAASSPTPPATAGTLFMEVVQAEAAAARKKWQKRRKEQQEPSNQLPLPFDDHTHCLQLQGNPPPSPSAVGREEADGPKSKSVKRSSSNKRHIQSVCKNMRTESRKQPSLSEGFSEAPDIASNPNADSTAFCDQFAYTPRHQYRSPPVPRMPDRVARPPPQGCLSSGSSQLIANKTSEINTSKTSKITISKTEHPGSGSTTKKQEKTKLKEMEKPVKKTRVKKDRKPPPLLTCAEKQSEKYCCLPLDQLVPPPRSPHKLLQEKYASDPWKVLVIGMLLNLPQVKQVRKKVKGFFRRYPDAQTAFNADPETMANYLAPLGLQYVKASRIQKFSKAYVEKEWTYATELCGVGNHRKNRENPTGKYAEGRCQNLKKQEIPDNTKCKQLQTEETLCGEVVQPQDVHINAHCNGDHMCNNEWDDWGQDTNIGNEADKRCHYTSYNKKEVFVKPTGSEDEDHDDHLPTMVAFKKRTAAMTDGGKIHTNSKFKRPRIEKILSVQTMQQGLHVNIQDNGDHRDNHGKENDTGNEKNSIPHSTPSNRKEG